MRVLLGLENDGLNKGHKQGFYWDTAESVNGHALLIGGSGTGKTTAFRKMASQFTQSGVARVHILDFHGDIQIPGESMIEFSASSQYGLNPLRISSDHQYGGVRKKIAEFVSTLSNSSRALGVKQEAVVRNLLKEAYEQAGFLEDDASTWKEADSLLSYQPPADRCYKIVPYEQRNEAKDIARSAGSQLLWDEQVRLWYTLGPCEALSKFEDRLFVKKMPTIDSLIELARFKLKELYFGTSSACVKAMEDLRTAVVARKGLEKRQRKALAVDDDEEIAKIDEKIMENKQKCVDLFFEYIKGVERGNEFENSIRYQSFDVMKSVVDRFENLKASGIFKAVEPNFDTQAKVWRSNLAALRKEERRLFMEFYLQALFSRRVEAGFVSGVQEVIMIDEAHTVYRDDEDNVLNTLILEARKFGIAVICASQSPEHFSDDFLSGVGMVSILGVAGTVQQKTVRKLHIPNSVMAQVAPKRVMATQVKISGQSNYPFKLVSVANENVSYF